MADTADTITAIATPAGYGAVGLVKVSGGDVRQIAQRILGRLPAPRKATYTRFLGADRSTVDLGVALFFPAPNSSTGEDVLELQAHGSPVVLDSLLEQVCAAGARLARPGEFSERAFLNGRIDLSQAEAIADLIESGTRHAAQSALRSLQGEFSSRVKDLSEKLGVLRTFVEASIDFPDEDIDVLSEYQVLSRMEALKKDLESLLEATRQGVLLRNGLDIVLAGAPNAGKSSLLNSLCRIDKAIVSDIPGTTRDLIEQSVEIDGLRLNFTDTAGLRVAGDEIENEGIARAKRAMAASDLVLLLIDDADPKSDLQTLLDQMPAEPAVILVLNKCDVSGRAIGFTNDDLPCVAISAKTGDGIPELNQRIKETTGFTVPSESTYLARRRHIDALNRVHAHLALAATRASDGALELIAEELRLGQNALGEITGEVTTEDLLGEIFGRFCIGK